MEGNYPRRRKTLWEKEKLLVMSNFSFSHGVFKRLVSHGRQMVSLCGNGLRKNRTSLANRLQLSTMNMKLFELFVCLGFYTVSMVFQLFNSDSSQIHVSWTIFNQYLTSPLTLSQMTNFRLFQTETVCRRQFQIGWKWLKVLQTGRKHCGKKRNCSLRAIFPFPTVFSKGLCCRHVKTRACLGKG